MKYYKRGELPADASFLAGRMQGSIIQGDKYVADVFSNDGPLFAAAPEMLESLQDALLAIVELYSVAVGTTQEKAAQSPLAKELAALIAKAKGET